MAASCSRRTSDCTCRSSIWHRRATAAAAAAVDNDDDEDDMTMASR